MLSLPSIQRSAHSPTATVQDVGANHGRVHGAGAKPIRNCREREQDNRGCAGRLGYRDAEYFKLKVFQRCSLPDNRWEQIGQ